MQFKGKHLLGEDNEMYGKLVTDHETWRLIEAYVQQIIGKFAKARIELSRLLGLPGRKMFS